jgi:predicted lipoprotein with Yx(FWY)xxD motif
MQTDMVRRIAVRRRVQTLVLVPVAAVAITACGSSKVVKTPPANAAAQVAVSPGATVQVASGTVQTVGTVLVDGQGRPLYSFSQDTKGKVTCTRQCAAVWPPLVVSSGQKVTAAGQVQSKLLGTVADPTGGRVVTYGGVPLYTYSGDLAPHMAQGEALDMDGGLWYAMAPSGRPA